MSGEGDGHGHGPALIILVSGKRKSGKDFVATLLQNMIPSCTIIRISAPIKAFWAEKLKLDFFKLSGDTEYKENYRSDMIKWSEEMRKNDYGVFCREACSNASPTKVWIVSDIRRKTDIKWFQETFKNKIKTVRVNSDVETRKQRGWVFTEGVDDVASECDLDDIDNWEFVINNDSENLETQLNVIVNALSSYECR